MPGVRVEGPDRSDRGRRQRDGRGRARAGRRRGTGRGRADRESGGVDHRPATGHHRRRSAGGVASPIGALDPAARRVNGQPEPLLRRPSRRLRLAQTASFSRKILALWRISTGKPGCSRKSEMPAVSGLAAPSWRISVEQRLSGFPSPRAFAPRAAPRRSPDVAARPVRRRPGHCGGCRDAG